MKLKFFSLCRAETRRLVLSKPFEAACVLCLFTPLLGYSAYFQTSSVDSLSIKFIANPVLASAFLGSVLWAALLLAEASRPCRNGTEALTGAAASPLLISAARMLAMAALLAAVTAVCACIYLPLTMQKMEYLFHPGFYFTNYFVFLFPTWLISVLLAEALYQISHRVELSALLYGMCASVSLGKYASEDYFMRWINPYVVSYSDGFLSYWPLRIGAYTRLMWLCATAGLWLLSLLCIRKYQKNIAVSFCYGIRKIYIPAMAMACMAAGWYLRKEQPFIDHGPEAFVQEPDWNLPQIPDDLTAESIHYSVTAQPLTGRILGRAEYAIKEPYTGEDNFALNPGYTVTKMTYGDEPVAFRTEGKDINGERHTYFRLPATPGKTLVIEYEGMPALAKFSATFIVDYSVDPDYIQLSQLAIAPLTNYYCENGDITIDITIPGDLVPYLEYAPMTEFTEHADGTKTWSSACRGYVRDFVAGHYVTDAIQAAGIQIDFTYGEAYRDAVESYGIHEAIADVFGYCKEHYGALGLAESKYLQLMQKSIMVMGGHAFPGVSEWFETVLSPLTLSDLDRGASAQEVFIHEMVHQWWGAFGLHCDVDGPWSDEGLTVYSTYRLVKEKLGKLYALQYYVDQWKQEVAKQDRNFYNRHPEYLALLPQTYQAELQAANESVNLYMRMPLLILKAEELVGGEEQMDHILKQMYKDREQYGYEKPFSYQDFLDYCGLTKEELELW